MAYGKELQSEERKEDLHGLLVSVIFHVTLVSFFTIKAIFFSPEPIDYSAAIRVDIVGLPDKLDPNTVLPPKEENIEKPAPAPKTPAEPAKKEVTKPTQEKTQPKEPVMPDKTKAVDFQKKQSDALNKLKAMAALDKIKKEAQQDQQSEASHQQYQVKGNVISPGTSLTGLDKINHESYLADLDQHIKQFWALPEWLASQDLKAQVRVQIDRNGNLLSKKIVRSSGNPTYDEYALETIERSVPFPRPPEKLSAIMEVNGFIVGFPE